MRVKIIQVSKVDYLKAINGSDIMGIKWKCNML